MQELRLVAVSEDGSYAVLVVPGRSGRFALPIDERLRTVARGQFSRLAQYEIEVESPLRPKEIQDRIRAGETAEEIADAAGLPVDRIRRFEGPVLAEREFRAKEAQRATVRSRTESGPGPRLGEIVTERLSEVGATPDEVDWDSRKRQDGNWQVQLAYTVAGRMYLAEWVYDPRSKHVTPDDDEAVRLCLSEAEWPEPRQPARAGLTATVTPIGSRAGSAGPLQPEHRTQTDRVAGNGALHPSRQAPAGVAAAGSLQPPAARPARLGRHAGEGVGQPAARTVQPAIGRPAQPGAGRETAGRTGTAGLRADGPGLDVTAGAGPESGAGTSRPGGPGHDGAGHDGAGQANPGRSAGQSAVQHSAGQHSAGQSAGQPGQPGAGQPNQPGAGQAADGAGARGADGQGQAGLAPADARPAEAPPARPGRRSGGRAKRSSVPSWDEIMFGNSRQPD